MITHSQDRNPVGTKVVVNVFVHHGRFIDNDQPIVQGRYAIPGNDTPAAIILRGIHEAVDRPAEFRSHTRRPELAPQHVSSLACVGTEGMTDLEIGQRLGKVGNDRGFSTPRESSEGHQARGGWAVLFGQLVRREQQGDIEHLLLLFGEIRQRCGIKQLILRTHDTAHLER